jgi:4-amino-4-deoxy-L-arabinose transferase-like glycosyltransferase
MSRVGPRAVLVGSLAAGVYLLVAGGFLWRFDKSPHDHHILIADAFLHGQTWVRPEMIEGRRERVATIVREPLLQMAQSSGQALSDADREAWIGSVVRQITDLDWTIVDGRYYGYWGPLLPAATTPVVALAGSGVSDRGLTAIIGALNVALMYWMFRRADRAGLVRVGPSAAMALTILFAFGTVHFYMSCAGTVWFATQQIALTAFLGALVAAFAPNERPSTWLASGACFALATLGRGILVLALPFFVALFLLRRPRDSGSTLRPTLVRAALFCAPLAMAGGIQAAYNVVRFGEIGETGYRLAMETAIDDTLRERFARYGTFDVRCIPRNVWHYFLSWNLPKQTDGRIGFDENGNSMFLVTPPLVYTLLAWRTRARMTGVLLAGLALPMAALLCLYFTGFRQFGNRFLLEFLPLLLLLVAIGMRGRVTLAAYALGVAAIVANLFGVYRYCDEQCRPIQPFVGPLIVPLLIGLAIGGGFFLRAGFRRDTDVS